MIFFKTRSARNLNLLVSGLAAALVLVLVLLAWLTPAPHLTIEHNDATIEVFAERAWTLLPNDCVRIRWEFDSALPIYIDGVEWRESGQGTFCPAVFSTGPKIELTDHRNNVYLSHSLTIHYLPDYLINVLGLTLLALFPMLALFYLLSNEPQRRPALRTILLAVSLLVLSLALMRLSGRALTIVGVLSLLRDLFADPRWHLFGACLAGLMYISLLIESLWKGFKHKRISDFLVLGAFLLFIGLLYLPFGFDTIIHWEQWRAIAYLENLHQFHFRHELTGRYWFLAPSALARAISSETFHGFNILYALILWTKLVLVYGILRQLRFQSLYAFLATMLFAVYPVDAGLMYTRAISIQFSILTLFTALHLILRYMRNPTRPYLTGIWLSLAMSVGIYEASYALILCLPILWWYCNRRDLWRNINLTVIWYLFPLLKLCYLLLLFVKQERFYLSSLFSNSQGIAPSGFGPQHLESFVQVFRETFFLGWSGSISNISKNPHLPLIISMLAVAGIVAWLLWRGEKRLQTITDGQNLLLLSLGILFVFLAVGVLIWIDDYSRDLWRLYLYVPLPAAIVVFGLLLFLSSRLADGRQRKALVAVLCLLLMLPAMSRLVLQHEHYVNSANSKGHILGQILRIAPEIGSQTRVLVISAMPPEELRRKHIGEMIESDMIGNALSVLYRGKTSGKSYLCISVQTCPPLNRWSWQDHLEDIIIFLLHQDLTVELVEMPSAFIRAYAGLKYDVTKLHNPDAPVPSRAYTMLGLSKQ